MNARLSMRERNACLSTDAAQGARIEGTGTMRKFGIAAVVAASVAASGCATYPNGYGYDPYYNNGYYQQGYSQNGYYNNGYQYDSQGRRIATGAVGGAVVGGIAGAVIPGVSVGTGAIAGAILGGVLGATVKGRQYYRDTRGYCYYVDQYGQPHYSYDIRC
jgi:outer membrane lipoprotein SlyB